MKILCSLALLAGVLASPIVAAEETLGRVRAVYAEVARGVLIDPRIGRAPASARRWADVQLGAAADGQRVLVQVPGDLQAAAGDLVAIQLEDRLPARLAAEQVPVLRVSRITEVRTRAFAGLGAASSGASAAPSARSSTPAQ